MIEKVINLEGVSLVDFLGVENENIKEISTAFPKSKIISRGNEIRIQGSGPEIIKINNAFNELLAHYRKYGKITTDNVLDYLETNVNKEDLNLKDEIVLYGAKGVAIRPKTSNQKQLVEAANKNDLVFAIGPAGTGKTYVAVALAVKALKNKQVKRIIITRPAVEAGESLGFLPGDLKEKVDPYLRPIYDALDDMIPSEKLNFYLENRIIEIAPLAYMRGRTLNNAFILLDEAQNTTPMQMKMFLTRMGADSKMIVTGDTSQIDLPPRVKSGLVEATHILKNTDGIRIIHLSGKDVIRHRLVKNIIAAYKQAADDGKTRVPEDNA
ncbi:PhoH family protein [Algivirga pacifica]|uniref:PhoH-like protein n=1 Tax=Algivirga pacifica TaxID=1162670 RepID=A0ABP9DET6_9BACT